MIAFKFGFGNQCCFWVRNRNFQRECVLSQELNFFMVRTYSLPGTILLFISKWLLPFFTQELYFSKRIGDWRIFSMYPVLSCQYCQLQFLKGPLNFASDNDLETNNIHAKNAIGFFMME